MAKPKDFLMRFWSKVDKKGENDCWKWISAVSNGYGYFSVANGFRMRAHVISYELRARMPLPSDMEIDHVCRNTLCVNPKHLEVVSHRENMLRGDGPTAINARKAYCIRGHPLFGANLYLHPKQRVCRICSRQSQQKYRNKQM